jgi:hypothetical protein
MNAMGIWTRKRTASRLAPRGSITTGCGRRTWPGLRSRRRAVEGPESTGSRSHSDLPSLKSGTPMSVCCATAPITDVLAPGRESKVTPVAPTHTHRSRSHGQGSTGFGIEIAPECAANDAFLIPPAAGGAAWSSCASFNPACSIPAPRDVGRELRQRQLGHAIVLEGLAMRVPVETVRMWARSAAEQWELDSPLVCPGAIPSGSTSSRDGAARTPWRSRKSATCWASRPVVISSRPLAAGSGPRR